MQSQLRATWRATCRLVIGQSSRGSTCVKRINKRAVVSCMRRSSSSTANQTNNGMTIYNSLTSRHESIPPKSSSQTSSSTHDTVSSPRGTAWYVCGPTVYDSAHLGHGRTYVSLDIIRRVALNIHSGSGNRSNGSTNDGSITPRPLYVMNITDVDDKIIKRSMENAKLGVGGETSGEADPLSLARYYEHEFWQDMDALNVLRPDVICRVSEHVESTIVPYIRQIVDGGMAYVIPEQYTVDGDAANGEDYGGAIQGSVYFDVRAFESGTNGRTKYGKLAPDVASTDFFSWEDNNGEGEEGNDSEGEPIRKKRDPRDFCLWKYRPRSFDDGTSPTTTIIEPESVSYSSPWGPGRPGWHVECSAMIQKLTVDFESTHEFGLHAGGVDLKFPHHSNEIAQAEAYMASDENETGDNCSKEWIPHWVHTGHLYVKGRKMSKSLKNFITIREMLGINEGDTASSLVTEQNNHWSSPADDFRLWCLGLSGAYRGPATYSQDRMDEARAVREKWIRFLIEGQECLDRWRSTGDEGDTTTSTRLWGDDELRLFQTVTQCSINCRNALLDDLDGSSFVKELTNIAETGLTYVEQTKSQPEVSRPQEPLRFVLDTLRGQLDLVGFTSKTVNAGISAKETSSDEQHGTTNSVLVDEAVVFRASVRSAALAVLRKKKDGVDAAKEILSLCDTMRNDAFPKLGIEILDGKTVENKGDLSSANRGWRHCSPRDSSIKA